MKATLAKDLVIGAIYSDIFNLSERSTLLKYTGESDKGYLFDRVGGPDDYSGDVDILMSAYSGPWYELSPSEIEQYLPTPPKG